MTDLRRGGTNRMRGARDPHVTGPIREHRTLVYAPDPARMLPDWECEHGRLPGDRTEVCGCWLQETFLVPRWDTRFRPECGGCGLSCDPGASVCVGCGRKLGVTV